MKLPLIDTHKEKEKSIEELIQYSSPRLEFFILIGLSVLMAALGVILDNDAVIIGSMVVAPLVYPIISLALGMTVLDLKLIWRSFLTFFQASILSFAVSFGAGYVLWHLNVTLPSSVFERTAPNLPYLGVSFVAGLIAALSFTKEKIRSYGPYPGIAIAVALIPPITVAGLALAQMQYFLLIQSFWLYVMNVAGIVVAGYLIFIIMHVSQERKMVQKKVAEDEKEIEKEEAEAE